MFFDKEENNCLHGVYLHGISAALTTFLKSEIPANMTLKCAAMCCNRMLIF